VIAHWQFTDEVFAQGSLHMADFASLSADDQEAIRQAQLKRKKAKREKHQHLKAAAELGGKKAEARCDGQPTRCIVTSDEYFSAAPHGRFRAPNLPPTAESLALLLHALDAGDKQAKQLSLCNYFQFTGSLEQLWDPTFNARLAWEGFFTITTSGPRGSVEPLPELQPYYGVLLWAHFESSKHNRQALARLAREKRGYELSDRAHPERTWRAVDAYHREHHGTNWLTWEYFEMLRLASENRAINFTLHCIELSEAEGAGPHEEAEPPGPLCEGSRVRLEGLVGRSDLNGRKGTALRYDSQSARWEVRCDDVGDVRVSDAPVSDAPVSDARVSAPQEHIRVKAPNLIVLPPTRALAGEIGFSIGGVYTSLSGWTGKRTADAVGTVQLVLLGRWLQQRGCAFWSLGHCYSPEMDYKRQLGHRIYTRAEFRALLQKHRGPFEWRTADEEAAALQCGERVNLRSGDRCGEADLLRM